MAKAVRGELTVIVDDSPFSWLMLLLLALFTFVGFVFAAVRERKQREREEFNADLHRRTKRENVL